MVKNPISRDTERRIQIVIKAIRDGCPDCPDRGLLCVKHIEIANQLVLYPVANLQKLETEIFGIPSVCCECGGGGKVNYGWGETNCPICTVDNQ